MENQSSRTDLTVAAADGSSEVMINCALSGCDRDHPLITR